MSSGHLERTTGSTAASSPAGADDLPENLRRLDRLASLGLLAASAAHEIKNGLVAISTFTEVLLEKNEDREMAEVVKRELKRIDSLVTQMLRYASPRPATLVPVPVHQVLDYSLRLLEHQMSGRGIVSKRDYRAQPGTVRGDEAQLQQVFMNLMLNAVEAISGSGELTVRTEVVVENAGAKKLKIHISDTGSGITPEHLPRVFEPFFTTKKNGTGLGLAICQRVAQEHQGYIEVQSEAGRGSTFIVSLAAE
ncbi:MAG TPA: ATP-binding protein [Verrucomicrobiae bacterium]|jgi:two-component system nitrogen regulation sensor histidine kinase GlnL